MEIIPAIDIRNGNCVRLLQGDFARETVYGEDPVAMAERWVEAGATRLHLVDLDGAREGFSRNLPVISRVARAVPVPVQLGGGLRTTEAVQAILDAGITRCILGTEAVRRPEWAQQMFATHDEKIVLGLDARDGMVATAGWQEATKIPAVAFARTMQEAGCRRIIFTDIARDGMLQGPNLDALRAMCAAVEIPVIASGGITRDADAGLLAAIPGVEAAIAGKALYEGTATLAGLQAAARGVVAGEA